MGVAFKNRNEGIDRNMSVFHSQIPRIPVHSKKIYRRPKFAGDAKQPLEIRVEPRRDYLKSQKVLRNLT